MFFDNIENLKYNIEIETGIIPKQPKECYYGNREYKLKIVECNEKKVIKRSTQMLFRLYEGNGRATYLIGIDDNGNIEGLTLDEMNISINNIIKITEIADCTIKKIKIYHFITTSNNSVNNTRFIVIIRLNKKIVEVSI
jgi:GTPase